VNKARRARELIGEKTSGGQLTLAPNCGFPIIRGPIRRFRQACSSRKINLANEPFWLRQG